MSIERPTPRFTGLTTAEPRADDAGPGGDHVGQETARRFRHHGQAVLVVDPTDPTAPNRGRGGPGDGSPVGVDGSRILAVTNHLDRAEPIATDHEPIGATPAIAAAGERLA
jgi:hypothetical protein